MATIKMDGIAVETVKTEEFVCIFASSQVLRSAEELFFLFFNFISNYCKSLKLQINLP